MEEKFAVTKADDLIKLMIQHQPNLFGTTVSPLSEVDRAKKAAQSLAALRTELIEQLKPQQ